MPTDDDLAELCARRDLAALLQAIDCSPSPTWTLVDLIGRLKARLDTAEAPLRHYRVAGDPGPGTTRIVVDTGEHIEIRQPDGRALAIVSLSLSRPATTPRQHQAGSKKTMRRKKS